MATSKNRSKLTITVVLTLAYLVIEVTDLFINSMALLAKAAPAHILTDVEMRWLLFLSIFY